jgi:hypothetical protein
MIDSSLQTLCYEVSLVSRTPTCQCDYRTISCQCQMTSLRLWFQLDKAGKKLVLSKVPTPMTVMELNDEQVN